MMAPAVGMLYPSLKAPDIPHPNVFGCFRQLLAAALVEPLVGTVEATYAAKTESLLALVMGGGGKACSFTPNQKFKIK